MKKQDERNEGRYYNNQINSIDDLRDHAVAMLEKLDRQEIDVAEAGVVGKLCESIISTVKVQLEYARMVKREPKIEFIGDCMGEMIEARRAKDILDSPSVVGYITEDAPQSDVKIEGI